MLVALIILLYLAISPVRSLITDLHLSAERRSQLHSLERTATVLAGEERSLEQSSTSDLEARNLGFVLPGEKAFVVKRLPSN